MSTITASRPRAKSGSQNLVVFTPRYSSAVISPNTITHGWQTAIAAYSIAQLAAGASTNTIKGRIQHLQRVAKSIPIEPWDMTSTDLLIWASTQMWMVETRRGRYNTYRSFWGWGKATKLCKKDAGKPLPKVRPGIPNPRPVPDRIYRRALARGGERERLIMRLAHDIGLRRCEVAVMDSRDIFEDLVGHSLLVHGKGGKDREVPLTLSLAAELLALPAGWCFPGDFDGHLSPRWIGRKVADLLGDGWTMHKLRHSAGTNFYLHGDLAIAQRLLGHASPATTMIYVKLPDERLRATIVASST